MLVTTASLISALSNDTPSQRASAAEALADLGPGAQPAAVALVRAVADSDETVRRWATSALEDLGHPATDQIRELISLTDHKTSDVAYWAVTLLGRAGSSADTAVGPLSAVLQKSSDLAVRERAAWALGEIGPAAKSALPALREAAAADEPRLARLAATALNAINQ